MKIYGVILNGHYNCTIYFDLLDKLYSNYCKLNHCDKCPIIKAFPESYSC